MDLSGRCAGLCGLGWQTAAARVGVAVRRTRTRRAPYPWGSTWDPDAVPAPEKVHDLPGPDNVDAHPKGASPFGVMDLTGNVWQWTESLGTNTPGRPYFAADYYQPQGSMWYFPQAYKLTEHGKLLLMSPSMDRSGGVGFRCVVDSD